MPVHKTLSFVHVEDKEQHKSYSSISSKRLQHKTTTQITSTTSCTVGGSCSLGLFSHAGNYDATCTCVAVGIGGGTTATHVDPFGSSTTTTTTTTGSQIAGATTTPPPLFSIGPCVIGYACALVGSGFSSLQVMMIVECRCCCCKSYLQAGVCVAGASGNTCVMPTSPILHSNSNSGSISNGFGSVGGCNAVGATCTDAFGVGGTCARAENGGLACRAVVVGNQQNNDATAVAVIAWATVVVATVLIM